MELGEAATARSTLGAIVLEDYRPQGWDCDAFSFNLFVAERRLDLGVDDHTYAIVALSNKFALALKSHGKPSEKQNMRGDGSLIWTGHICQVAWFRNAGVRLGLGTD